MRRKMKKKKKMYVPYVHIPTFLGARLNTNNWNQMWNWNTLKDEKF